MITSTQNPRVKWVRALQAKPRQRRKEGVMVIEGVRLAEEALQAGWGLRLVFHSHSLNARGRALLRRISMHCECIEEVSPAVMRAISDTQTPQGILAVVAVQAAVIPPSLDFALVVDGVRDPGNLGTILRTAAAAGVQAVFVAPGSADVYSPKVVRAAMGAHFRANILPCAWKQVRAYLRPLQVFLADAYGEVAYDEVDYRSPIALIIGGEAEGATRHAQELAAQRVSIPMPGKTESLNAAVAAGILLFEALRQRRSALL